MKRILAVALLALCVVLLSCNGGGGNNPPGLVGQWVCTEGCDDGDMEWEFFSDGSVVGNAVVKSKWSGESTANIGGTWKVVDKRLLMSLSSSGYGSHSQALNYKVSGYELTMIEDNGDKQTFVRKGKLEEFKAKQIAAAEAEIKRTLEQLSKQMVPVSGGTFMMGCTAEQEDECYDNEKPAHSVTVGDFSIGKYEVTQVQWQTVMGENPSEFTGDDNLPVEQVSWNDVQTFIQKLNEKTGKKYRLPTEAEWEFAARGGNKSKGYKYSGSDNIGDVGWYLVNSGDKPIDGNFSWATATDKEIEAMDERIESNNNKTHTVGGKKPNELGIYDMTGNVLEWVSDWYGDYSSGAQTNPIGLASGSTRVARGGSWGNDARYCRVSNRYIGYPGVWLRQFGFSVGAFPIVHQGGSGA